MNGPACGDCSHLVHSGRCFVVARNFQCGCRKRVRVEMVLDEGAIAKVAVGMAVRKHGKIVIKRSTNDER